MRHAGTPPIQTESQTASGLAGQSPEMAAYTAARPPRPLPFRPEGLGRQRQAGRTWAGPVDQVPVFNTKGLPSLVIGGIPARHKPQWLILIFNTIPIISLMTVNLRGLFNIPSSFRGPIGSPLPPPPSLPGAAGGNMVGEEAQQVTGEAPRPFFMRRPLRRIKRARKTWCHFARNITLGR